jgi:glucosamine-6-phosphate deaminase
MKKTAQTESEQRERIRTIIHDSADAACELIAQEIAELVRSREAEGKHTVLGLATGSTPVRLYRHLIALHRLGHLSFRRVITFNLDEYFGLTRDHPESYWRFMHEQLFDHVDIPRENINIPDGTLARANVFAACHDYEERIRQAGGIDLQVLGIGRTGHIGFNEPGSGRDSRTRLVTLDALTRQDAARDFLGEANVPRYAITMGVGTILEARRIVLLAWGQAKAPVIARAIEGNPTETLPASLLQGHPAIACHLDRAAAEQLTRVNLPWLVGPVAWTSALSRRAVVWLSLLLRKPVLKLLDEDYSEHGMGDLLTEQGPAYGLNIRVFNQLQHTITGWPGGKPSADDSHRPERAEPAVKRVLILSPEPSDDVLGMGGTIRRLVEQGHDVRVVHLTSGNLGVPDEEALMATELVRELAEDRGEAGDSGAAFARKVARQLQEKSKFATDAEDTRRLKGIIRRGEARAALRECGVEASRIKFIDLAFYERGRYRQFRPETGDRDALAALLSEFQPHQIFATGASADPSSVPAVCFTIFRQALAHVRSEKWVQDCRVWLYNAPDQTWDPATIDMAVPLSPEELNRKTFAIYHHKSQRSQRPTAGSESESWQQAEQRNRALAASYDALGLANYEAIEAFQRWHVS